MLKKDTIEGLVKTEQYLLKKNLRDSGKAN
jgi:hypothetical protein